MLKQILKTATFKQSQITVAGTIINGLLGLGFLIFLANYLGPANYGLFTIAVITMVLIADIADIGTNTGLVRFVASNLITDRNKAYRFLKLSLKIKFIAWIVSFTAVFSLAPFLANQVFHKAELILPLRLASFGVGSALFFTFATSALQAYQKYFLWSLVNILSNALRLCLTLLLGYSLLLNLQNSLIAYIVFPFIGFFITLLLLPTRKIIQSKDEFSLAKEFLQYNLRVAAFTIISTISSKLDTYLTAILLSSKEVGVYGAATTLVQYVPQLVSALGLVSSPKFASFPNNQQMLSYFKKFQLLVLGLVGLGILILPVLTTVIPIVLGSSYQGSVTPFVILFLAQMIFLFSIPIHHSIIFYFGRPDVFIWIALGNLFIMGGLGYILISNFGITGAAITVFFGTSFNFLYPLIWLLVKLKNKKD